MNNIELVAKYANPDHKLKLAPRGLGCAFGTDMWGLFVDNRPLITFQDMDRGIEECRRFTKEIPGLTIWFEDKEI